MTIKDIADTLHLSIATVSKALNNSTDISEETKKSVCEYADSVGYRSRKSVTPNGRVAILWGRSPREDEPLFEIASAFREAAEAARYVVETTVADENFDLNDYLGGNHFYGAILLGLNFRSPLFPQLKNTQYPLVLADNYLTGNPLISGVGSDNIHAVEEAVDYLVSLGHTQIAFLGGERESLVGTERFGGYVLGLARNSIEYRYDLTYFGDYSRKSGADAAEYFLTNDKHFTAIICASDLMALGFVERMRVAGVSVPEDISVIGYDDLKSVAETGLALTTVKQDCGEAGRLGFHTLECLMKGMPSQRTLIRHTLVPRATTRKIN